MLRARLAAGRPSIGLCLGAQLLAAAAGSRVFRGARGKVVGVGPVARVGPAEDPLLRELPDTFDAVHWHGDTFEPVPGHLLFGGETYPAQGFRVGRSVGIQFHAELGPEGFRDWVEGSREDLRRSGRDPDALLAEGLPRLTRPALPVLDRLLEALALDARAAAGGLKWSASAHVERACACSRSSWRPARSPSPPSPARSRTLSGFTRIELAAPVDVEVRPGAFQVTLEMDSDVARHLVTQVEDDALHISLDGRNLNVHGKPRIKVRMPAFRGVRIQGSGDVDIAGFKAQDKVELRISGSGDIRYAGTSPGLAVAIEGSGDVVLSEGETGIAPVERSRARETSRPRSFKAKNVSVAIEGSGDADIRVAGGALKLSVNGSGTSAGRARRAR